MYVCISRQNKNKIQFDINFNRLFIIKYKNYLFLNKNMMNQIEDNCSEIETYHKNK